jgi:hypothetical protein
MLKYSIKDQERMASVRISRNFEENKPNGMGWIREFGKSFLPFIWMKSQIGVLQS